MRLRSLAGVLFVLSLLVSTAHAQDVRVTSSDGVQVTVPTVPVQSGIDYYTPIFSNGYVDVEPLAPTPCGPSRVLKSATPIVYDGTLMVLYVCTNAGTYENPGQTTIWRRYFRPGNQDALRPQPVYLVNPATGAPAGPLTAPVLSAPTPGPVLYQSCDPGFVRIGVVCVRQ